MYICVLSFNTETTIIEWRCSVYAAYVCCREAETSVLLLEEQRLPRVTGNYKRDSPIFSIILFVVFPFFSQYKRRLLFYHYNQCLKFGP